jgi:hypothetical protein
MALANDNRLADRLLRSEAQIRRCHFIDENAVAFIRACRGTAAGVKFVLCPLIGQKSSGNEPHAQDSRRAGADNALVHSNRVLTTRNSSRQ